MPSAADHVQRGFYSSLGNWPLVLIGVAVHFIITVFFIVSAVIAVIPLIFIGIVSASSVPQGEAEQWIETFFFEHPFVLLYIVVLMAVVLIPIVLLYSFAQAAKTGVLIDGEQRSHREAGSLSSKQFAAFEAEAWARHGKAHWWAVFGVINIVWTAWALLLLIAVIVVAFLLWSLRDNDALIAIGCGATVVTFTLLTITAIFTAVWSQLAVIERVRHGVSARAASRAGWQLVTRRFGSTMAIQLLMIAVSLGVGALIVSIYFGSFFLAQIPGMIIVLIPIKIALSVIQSGIGAFLGNWLTAAFVSFEHESGDVIEA